MKILMVNKFLHPNGGSETYIFEIGKCLKSMGHEVEYFGMEHEGRIVGNHAEIYTKDMDFHSSGVKGKQSKLTYPFKIIRSREAYSKMRSVLNAFHPDAVHFNNINFQLTPAVIEAVADHDIQNRTETKMLYTAHDAQWVCPNHLLMRPDGARCFDCKGARYGNCVRNRCIHNSRLRSMLGAFEAWFYRHRKTYGLVDVIIAPSEFMKNTLETDPVLSGKCVVLHNFVPEADGDGAEGANTGRTVECGPQNGGRTGERYGDRYAVYFGRYSKEKGIGTLIKCIKALPDINFVFAGSGSMEDEINGLANVKNIGFTTGKELRDLISGACFAIFPSECHENCSFSVMESISWGTPLIASDTGGTPELVRDGENGILFKAGDEEELTSLIRRLWDSAEAERLREGCMNTRFMSVREYCEKLVDIYETG